jgi:FkbM family methyltransferase
MRQHLKTSRGERIALVLVLMAGSALGGYAAAFEVVARRAAAFSRFDPSDATELSALARTYGPERNSRDAEEWIVRDFFKDARNGTFVDVGASHHQQFSNSYYLETALGWSGVAIEPQAKFAGGYERFRPRTTFVPLFVSDVSNVKATLFVPANDLMASSSREFAEAFGRATPTEVTTTTLDDILDRLGFRRIDFLSMDIELAEPKALAGFSIERFLPRLVAIEAHPPVRQQILDYFTGHDYSLVGKYWRVDSENFWFAPRGSVTSGLP